MEEWVGGWWHRLVTGAAARQRPDYPAAAVTLAEMEKTLGLLFRAFGGDAGLRLASATSDAHGARRSWRERLAGVGEQHTPARRDGHTLRLPPRLALFPDARLNRELYAWLAAQAANPPPAEVATTAAVASRAHWADSNRRASLAALTALPGLAGRYHRLVAAHLPQRRDPTTLPPDEAAEERAIRRVLADPAQPLDWPVGTATQAPQPVPLWLSEWAGLAEAAAPAGGEANEGGGAGEASPGNAAEPPPAHRARQVATPDNRSPLVLPFRAESLLSWADYLQVNRAFDEEPDPQAAEAAADLDRLSLMRDGQTTVSRLRFDLDLPSAAADDVPLGAGLPLPEWDYRRQQLLSDHVRIQPLLARQALAAELPPALRLLAKRLRGQFAALVPQRRWLKAQPDGVELDVDAWVRQQGDRAAGQQATGGVWLAPVACERDLACLLLADLSLSTDAAINDQQRIIDVIRDSLLLFAEALTATGDRFGVYGFSSLRRNNVRFHLLKDFAAPYDAAARGRILAIKPGFYTRMGAAIRQASQVLAEQPASRRLLLLLTDGKPNDLDLYDSRYGIEDTRMAVHEARRQGLRPFCVTIDREGASYLPHLFGPAGYTVIRHAEELPRRLPQLYVQLTQGG